MTKDIRIETGKEDIQATMEEFLSLVDEVPWGNSDWQNRQAIVNLEQTPERAYRHASLRIMNRLQALNECYYNLQKEEIQIERLRRKRDIGDDLDKREAELEIELLLSRRPYTEKLIKDAVREIESLAPVIQQIGKLTREQFEVAEEGHFKLKYENLLCGKHEALLGLEAMGIDLQSGLKTAERKTLFDRITVGKSLPHEGDGRPG